MGIDMNLFSFFYMLTSSYANTIFEDAFSFPLYNFSFFGKNQALIGVFINIWVFDSIPLANLSVFMPILSCFHYCCSAIEFEVRDGNASRSSFTVKDCFGYPEFLFFHIKLIIVLSRSVKNFVGILMGIVLNL